MLARARRKQSASKQYVRHKRTHVFLPPPQEGENKKYMGAFMPRIAPLLGRPPKGPTWYLNDEGFPMFVARWLAVYFWSQSVHLLTLSTWGKFRTGRYVRISILLFTPARGQHQLDGCSLQSEVLQGKHIHSTIFRKHARTDVFGEPFAHFGRKAFRKQVNEQAHNNFGTFSYPY